MKKHIYIFLMILIGFSGVAQELDKTQKVAQKKANNFVYEGNQLLEKDFVEAEMAYRKAISQQPSTVAGNYNLGNSYYEEGNYEEALFRHQKAIEQTVSKSEKHKAYHNIGNILMKNKKCQEAVEAYKNALRNDPSDNETRYNLGLAKICAEQQKDQNEDNKDDKNDQNEDNKDQQDEDKKDQEGDNKEDQGDQNEEDKKDGEDKKDEEGEPKEDEKNDQGNPKEENQQPQKPQPQPGQLSPQQVKSLLEAMNNQEQKVQEKINEEKQKGVKVKTDKDW